MGRVEGAHDQVDVAAGPDVELHAERHRARVLEAHSRAVERHDVAAVSDAVRHLQHWRPHLVPRHFDLVDAERSLVPDAQLVQPLETQERAQNDRAAGLEREQTVEKEVVLYLQRVVLRLGAHEARQVVRIVQVRGQTRVQYWFQEWETHILLTASHTSSNLPLCTSQLWRTVQLPIHDSRNDVGPVV